jgi:hypothetical protein
MASARKDRILQDLRALRLGIDRTRRDLLGTVVELERAMVVLERTAELADRVNVAIAGKRAREPTRRLVRECRPDRPAA